jgi:hypothetical protein
MRSDLCKRRWPGHGGDTKPTARARQRHRDKSTTSRFRRGGVQGQGGQKGSNLGSMARRTHVRRCVGVRGDGTAERRAWLGVGVRSDRTDRFGSSVFLTRKNRVSARWWCLRATHRRRGHGDGTTPTTCARQGTETGGRRAGKCARRGSVLTRLLAKERQGLGSTARAQRVGAGGKPKLGDARRTKERHNCKAKECTRR